MQAAATVSAAQAATGELSEALQAAEARGTALAESLAELQEALERQRAEADVREEMLQQVRAVALSLSSMVAAAAAAANPAHARWPCGAVLLHVCAGAGRPGATRAGR
jgi:phage tail tape-measure protein